MTFSTIERLGIVTAFAITTGFVVSFLINFTLSIQTFSLGLLITGVVFIVLGLVFCCESYSHHRSRKVQFHVDRTGQVQYLPGASRRVSSQKHEEPPTPKMSKTDWKVLAFIFIMGLVFAITGYTIHVLFVI